MDIYYIYYLNNILIYSNNKIQYIKDISNIFKSLFKIDLLYKLKSFFGEVGNISIPSSRQASCLKITGLNEIFNYIIPHFKQYPLQSCKKLIFSYGHNVWKSWLIKNI